MLHLPFITHHSTDYTAWVSIVSLNIFNLTYRAGITLPSAGITLPSAGITLLSAGITLLSAGMLFPSAGLTLHSSGIVLWPKQSCSVSLAYGDKSGGCLPPAGHCISKHPYFLQPS